MFVRLTAPYSRTGRPLIRAAFLLATQTAAALLLCMTLATNARADSASCTTKLSAYIAALDQLLSTERNSTFLFQHLNQRYFPLRGCELDALLEGITRSKFLRSKFHAGGDIYGIVFSNGKIEAGFSYSTSKMESESNFAAFAKKP
jgi:hypothetical protein